MLKESVLSALDMLEEMKSRRLSGTLITKLPIEVKDGAFFRQGTEGFPVYVSIHRYPRRGKAPRVSVFTVSDREFFPAHRASFLTNEEFVDAIQQGLSKLKEFSVDNTAPFHKECYVEVFGNKHSYDYDKVSKLLDRLDEFFTSDRYIEERKEEVVEFIEKVEDLREKEHFYTAFVGVSSVARIDTTQDRTPRQYVYLAVDRDGYFFRSKVNTEENYEIYRNYFHALALGVLPKELEAKSLNDKVGVLYNKAGGFLLAGSLKGVVKSTYEIQKVAPPVVLSMKRKELEKAILSVKKESAVKNTMKP